MWAETCDTIAPAAIPVTRPLIPRVHAWPAPFGFRCRMAAMGRSLPNEVCLRITPATRFKSRGIDGDARRRLRSIRRLMFQASWRTALKSVRVVARIPLWIC